MINKRHSRRLHLNNLLCKKQNRLPDDTQSQNQHQYIVMFIVYLFVFVVVAIIQQ